MAWVRREPVPECGLTPLVVPPSPTLDIVFVHGFTGHPERTWTHKHGVGPEGDQDDEDEENLSSRFRRLGLPSSRSRSQQPQETPVYWPRDLLPSALPHARIMAYGYDTHIRHALVGPRGNQSTVYDMAWDFLVALEAGRRDDPSRPLLFVAHSLGGIFSKEALRRSHLCQSHNKHLFSVFASTIGIVFFGTPHGGSDPMDLPQRVFKRILNVVGFSANESVVQTLLPSAERLRELRDEFGPIAAQQSWIVHSFQESMGVTALGGKKVVEDSSSYLGLATIETTEHIGRNHMDMCRFTGHDDAEYKKAVAALTRVASNIPAPPSSGTVVSEDKEARLSEDHIRDLIESLKFDQIDSRLMNISDAKTNTCRWFLGRPEYLDWLDPSKLPQHRGFLWMKGKAGTGKSTLMKFALTNVRKSAQGSASNIVISFFFHARGSDLEKSITGMYRSLVVQLLEQVPRLQVVFELQGFAPWNLANNAKWTVPVLQGLFQEAVLAVGNLDLTCFIDALDECDEDQIRDMVDFFQDLGDLCIAQSIRFHIFFASRHYPHIALSDGRGIEFVLEGQAGHGEDLAAYINSQLKVEKGHEEVQLRKQLQEKSSNIFLWVVLVVKMLNKQHSRGRNARQMQQTLEKIPGDLHSLFCDIITRDDRNKNEFLLCIQWLLFSKEQLSPAELYHGILAGMESTDLFISDWDYQETSPDRASRFILDCSKGIVEITTTMKETSVQFIHESVRDFLLKEDGLRDIWPEVSTRMEALGSDALKVCCARYLDLDMKEHLNSGIRGPSLSGACSATGKELRLQLQMAFPLFEYASQYILLHANDAQAGGVCQKAFLASLSTSHLAKFSVYPQYFCQRTEDGISLLYILAALDLPGLITEINAEHCRPFEEEKGRYGAPILAGMAMGSSDAVRVMLKLEWESKLRTPWPLVGWNSGDKRQFRQGIFEYWLGRHKSAGQSATMTSALCAVSDDRNIDILRCLLEMSKAPWSSASRSVWLDPLTLAAENGSLAAVKVLLSHGWPANLGSSRKTALDSATRSGHGDIVRVLVEHHRLGVLNESPKLVRDPALLCQAAYHGNLSMARAFLDHGWDVNGIPSEAGDFVVDGTCKRLDPDTPLGCAASRGKEDMVRLLLQYKADMRITSPCRNSHLYWACERGLHEVVSEWIASVGVLAVDETVRGGDDDCLDMVSSRIHDINEISPNSGMTPLATASKNGHKRVVDILLDHGADVNMPSGEEAWTPLTLAAVRKFGADDKSLDFEKHFDPQFGPIDRQVPWKKVGRSITAVKSDSRSHEISIKVPIAPGISCITIFREA